MKKVIFVGGTSYSGSTFLDMTLSNQPDGFSCGEVSSLFNPYRDHHLKPTCACSDSECSIWDEVSGRGKKELYEGIFSRFKNVKTIVDSSKDPIWIKEQIEILKGSDVQVKNVLIWKTPMEAAFSFYRRGRIDSFERSWVNYHRLYFSLIKTFSTIKYHDLTTDPSSLKKLCNELDLEYFDGKKDFWNKDHHTLFGNNVAKIHLCPNTSTNYNNKKEVIFNRSGRDEDIIKNEYKKIYYKEIQDHELENYLISQIRNEKKLEQVKILLEDLSLSNVVDCPYKNNNIKCIKMIPLEVFQKKFNRRLRSVLFKFRRSLLGGRAE